MYPKCQGNHTTQPSFPFLNFPQAPSPGQPPSLGSPAWEGAGRLGRTPVSPQEDYSWSQAAGVSGTWVHGHGSSISSSSASEARAATWPPVGAHTLVGGFSSALEPGNPFSVLSFPEELTRHSFLEREKGGEGADERVRRGTRVRAWLWTEAWALRPAPCRPHGPLSGKGGKRSSH